MYELKSIQEYLKNKSIVLLGNANSIFNNKKDIDSFEVVCRCNWAFPDLQEPTFNINDYKDYIGTRTDVLFTSANLMQPEKLQHIIKPKFLIRTREDNRVVPKYILENSVLLVSSWYVHDDFFPTTGCLAFWFLMKEVKFKDLTLCGFDFFTTRSHTEPNKRKITATHQPEKEEHFITEEVKKHSNVKLIIG